MNRADKLRAARSSPQIIFADYLKLRSRWNGLLFVFEGKQCPSVYVAWVSSAFPRLEFKQLIAKGKNNVIDLRELIKRNSSTSSDVNAYFVDRDYDVKPEPSEFRDLYVTRGYSIENELVGWSSVERYIRANFDINCADDDLSLREIRLMYDDLMNEYLRSTKNLHQALFICRRSEVRCYHGDDIRDFLDFDWETRIFKVRQVDWEELLTALKVDPSKKDAVLSQVEGSVEFLSLEPLSRWRGKFHFDFLRRFLIEICDARRRGAAPFTSAAKVVADPSHPGVLGQLASFTRPPQCVMEFLEQYSDAEDDVDQISLDAQFQ